MPLCLGASGSVRARRMPQSLSAAPRGPHLLAGRRPTRRRRARPGCAMLARSRAGVGLAEELAPDLVAPEHRPEVALLLLVGAVAQDRGPGHADAHGEGVDGHAELAGLLAPDRPTASPCRPGRRTALGQVMPAQPCVEQESAATPWPGAMELVGVMVPSR